MDQHYECLDGNEAAARVAYAVSEVIAIYPITPASPMAEHCDDWSAAGRPNLWGKVPDVVEMQSEAGAAGALHGALQKGALATTFTASQGLLLMIPNMFKIAGELTPAVIHVAARTIATHALSIFGDHSDVMHARTTGWAMLAAGSVQEAHDFALVAHAATLRARVPFLHFFDGFRTSHEINKIAVLDEDDIRALVRDDDVLAFRDARPHAGCARRARHGAEPGRLLPGARGVQPVPPRRARDRPGRHGRARRHGPAVATGSSTTTARPDAERVIVVMGSASGAVEETVDALVAAGEKVGMLRIRLFRPFPAEQIVAALPPTVRSIAVLDRTKEPGAVGEPLYLDVVAALAEAMDRDASAVRHGARVIGGRYGLSSKEFTPVDDQADLRGARARRGRSGTSRSASTTTSPTSACRSTPTSGIERPAGEVQAVFFGLGSDGTVGREQGIGQDHRREHRPVRPGLLRVRLEEVGVDHGVAPALRARAHPLDLPHRGGRLRRLPPVRAARQDEGARVAPSTGRRSCSTPRTGRTRSGTTCPAACSSSSSTRSIDFWVIDALAVADETGMGNRINTVMQPCFFHLAGVLPADEAIAPHQGVRREDLREARRGRSSSATSPPSTARSSASATCARRRHRATSRRPPPVPDDVPDFVARVTSRLMAGDGDLLPVSALPVDGTFPTGTAKYEKRAIAQMIPIWDPDICIDCGKCAIVCPHATIRMKVFPTAAVEAAPATSCTRRSAPATSPTIG